LDADQGSRFDGYLQSRATCARFMGIGRLDLLAAVFKEIYGETCKNSVIAQVPIGEGVRE